MLNLIVFKNWNLAPLSRLLMLAGALGLWAPALARANTLYYVPGGYYSPYASGSGMRSVTPMQTAGDSNLIYMPGIDGEPLEAVIAQAGCQTCRHGYQARVSTPAPIRVRGRQAGADVAANSGPLPHAREIQANMSVGLGAGKGMCARAVWRILLKSGLARGSWSHSGADAKDMGRVLAANGFRNDMRVCNRPGVVRVYGGNASGHRFRNPMKGDSRGHIEILGLDRRYHSFFSSGESISQAMKRKYGYASRRPLIQCWYKP